MNPLMQAHSGAKEQKDEQLSTITRKIVHNEERLSQVKASQAATAPLDKSTPWTRNYERWDMWEDTDELEKSLDADKQQQNNLLQSARSMTGCGSHDRSAEKRVYELPPADRLREMKAFREMGNAYYDEGQYARATMKYKRVQVFYEYFFDFDSPAQEAETNQAACFLKLKAYAETLEQCEQALKLDKDNVKCLYRQAVALRLRDRADDLKVARKSLERAIALDPEDLALCKEMIKLRGKERSNLKNEKAMAKRMVGGDGGEGEGKGKENVAKGAQSQFQQSESVLQLSFGDKKLELDDLFVPIVVDVEKAQETIDGLLGINLSDATSLRRQKHQEEKASGGLSWAFRHPASCECDTPNIDPWGGEGDEGDDVFVDYDEEEEEDEEVAVEEVVAAEVLGSVDSTKAKTQAKANEKKPQQQELFETNNDDDDKVDGGQEGLVGEVVEVVKVEEEEVKVAEEAKIEEEAKVEVAVAPSTPVETSNVNMNAIGAVVVVLIGCTIKMNVHPMVLAGIGLGVGLIAERQLTANKSK